MVIINSLWVQFSVVVCPPWTHLEYSFMLQRATLNSPWVQFYVAEGHLELTLSTVFCCRGPPWTHLEYSFVLQSVHLKLTLSTVLCCRVSTLNSFHLGVRGAKSELPLPENNFFRPTNYVVFRYNVYTEIQSVSWNLTEIQFTNALTRQGFMKWGIPPEIYKFYKFSGKMFLYFF